MIDPNQQPPSPSAKSAPRSTGPRVHLLDASPPHYSDEFAALLRRRLKHATLIGTVFFIVAYIPVLHYPGLALRTAVILILAGCHLLLRGSAQLSLKQLQAVDLLSLAAIATQMAYMPDILILERARAGDAVTVIMDRYFNLGAWCMLIVTYGLGIPNPWRRALVINLTLSAIPYLNFYLLGLYEPLVAAAFATPYHHVPFPLPVMGALLGVYISHTLNSMRREVHQAQQFGQYRLREKLGSGGMGEVYRAEHALLKRPCAIKLIRPDTDADPDAIARFEQEVQATAQLSHPNTVDVYDYGRTDEGIFYYVMELLPGLSLADLLDQHGLVPPERVVYLLVQVCGALQEAHALGLIHRDIKPANIFVSRRGGVDDVAKLLDFGLVARADTGEARGEGDRLIVGSPLYMSPEQGAAEAVDGRSDIYSLGAVAYHVVTGQPPLERDTALECIAAHATDPVLPPALRNPDVPSDLEQVILRCLEKQPDQRFPDAASLAQALAKCACASQWTAERAAEWWRVQTAPPKPVASLTPRHVQVQSTRVM
ncbi:MAG: serine/threonine protein kinase [Planctomycetia bacterium]|nr:serine/threonine protein kinase [Planctomycetia bacterium]